MLECITWNAESEAKLIHATRRKYYKCTRRTHARVEVMHTLTTTEETHHVGRDTHAKMFHGRTRRRCETSTANQLALLSWARSGAPACLSGPLCAFHFAVLSCAAAAAGAKPMRRNGTTYACAC